MSFLNYHGKDSQYLAGDSEALVPVSLAQYVVHYLYGANEQLMLKPASAMIKAYEKFNAKPIKEMIKWSILGVEASPPGQAIPHGIILGRKAAKNVIDFVYYVEGSRGARLAVGPCICQLAAGKNPKGGTEAEKKDITLLYAADIYLDLGLDYREINNVEANEILEEMHKEGYIHNIAYMFGATKGTFVMCNCDNEICSLIKAARLFGKEGAPGPEICERDETKCLGKEKCGKCIERCPFSTSIADGDKIIYDSNKCFGCELCVTTCEGKARKLVERMDYKYDSIMSKKLLLAGQYGYDELKPL